MSDVLVLQITMLLLILIGALVKKIGIISPTGQKNINDLVINLVLPCNIVKSFLIDFDHQILRQFALVLVISIAIQICSVIIGKVLYGKKEVGHRMSLQYGVICSNAGFLGNPVAEGVFGSIGLAMASIFLIPMRIMMWSSGIAIYTQSTDWKGTLKKVATHPCIIACFVGLILMLTQWQLPAVAENTITTIGNCIQADRVQRKFLTVFFTIIKRILDGAGWIFSFSSFVPYAIYPSKNRFLLNAVVVVPPTRKRAPSIALPLIAVFMGPNSNLLFSGSLFVGI